MLQFTSTVYRLNKKISRRKNGVKRLTYNPQVVKQVKKLQWMVDHLECDDDELFFLKNKLGFVKDQEELLSAMMQIAQFIKYTRTPLDIDVTYQEVFQQVVSDMDPDLWKTISNLNLMASFEVEAAEEIEVDEIVPHAPGAVYGHVQVHKAIIQNLFFLDGMFGYCFNHPFSLAYTQTKKGVPLVMAAGLVRKSYLKAINKLKNNKVSPKTPLMQEALFAIDVIASRFRLDSGDLRELDLSEARLAHFMKGKNTSLGYIPAKFYKIVNGMKVTVKGVKKNEGYKAVLHLFRLYRQSIRNYLDGGDKPLNIFIEVEATKYELLRWMDILDMDPDDETEEFVEKCLNKLRLFYMSSGVSYVMDKAIYELISNKVRFHESGIGVKPEAGGFPRMWEILSKGPASPNYKQQQKIIDKWLKRGIDLTETVSGVGDFSSYDQTLLAVFLAVSSSLAVRCYKPSKDVPADELRYLLTDFILNQVHKIMYIHGLDKHVAMFGGMFSGKFGTSIIDTIVQMVIFRVYIGRLLNKFPDSELLSDIISYGFIVKFFYGDDHIFNWPKVMETEGLFLYEESETFLLDFVTFCTDECGMIYKKSAYQEFPDVVYSERHFYTTKEGFRKENLEEAVQGPDFLQNQCARVHLDGVFIGVFPYRPTTHILAKMGFSTSATKSPYLAMCLYSSLARLCSGNLEAYDMLDLAYTNLVNKFGVPEASHWNSFLNSRNEHSLRLYLQELLEQDLMEGFPAWEDLASNQIGGVNKNKAFYPLHANGQHDSEGPELYGPIASMAKNPEFERTKRIKIRV